MFDPRAYLAEYYASVSGENAGLVSALATAWREIEGRAMLEFGGGPTVYQLVPAAPRVEQITFADRLAENLAEVRRWKAAGDDAFDWTAFIQASLRHELGRQPAPSETADRAALVRSRITQLASCDAFGPDLVDGHPFDVVSSHFVAESISATWPRFETALDAVAAHVATGGTLVLSALRRAQYWRVGERRHPAVSLEAASLRDALAARSLTVDCCVEIDADVADPADPGFEGYDGLLVVRARRR